MRNGRPILETALILCCLSVVSPTYAQDPHLNERHLAILRLKGEESYERALAQAKRLATEHPDFDKVYGIIFDLYVLLDDIDEARAFFEELFQRDPQNPYALYVLARIDFHVGDLDRAIERLKQTITLDPGFAEAYGPEGGLPDVYQAKKDLDAAIAYFEALTITDAGNANAFSGLGWSYARSFQFAPAIEAFSKALEFDADLTQAFHGLVQTYFRTGRLQKSLEYCQQLSQAAERNGDVETLAYARMMQGTIFWFRGDYRTALHYLNGSRKLAQEIGDKRREASTVGNIAAVYATAGNYEKALEYFETSVANARDGGETTAEINALSNIGSVHKEIGNNERALSYYEEALVIARKAGLKRQECETLANMAEAFQRRGDHGEAHVYFSNALRIAQEIENKTFEAFALGSLGSLSRDRGDYADALGYFNKALALGEETDGVQLLWEAQAGLGSTYERQGNVEKAIAHYTEAIALYDSVREGLAIESLGSSFLEDKYQAYPSIVQLLASQGKLEDAFTYTEKFKAKGFLDILARAPTLFESHLPESLLLELDGVRSELQETHAELSRARSGSTPDSEAIVALEQRVTDLELRKASLVEQAREEHGEFVELAVSEPLDAESLQSRVLEPGQALIEYLMGDEKLSIFVVTRDELRYREV
ncbi:MAG TPA: tetratricopeptide repeat protein, partial [Vicinamibacteria bacterium]|nr:tetratricopeptide repeat protein [Vicinamibacteria bacterium]